MLESWSKCPYYCVCCLTVFFLFLFFTVAMELNTLHRQKDSSIADVNPVVIKINAVVIVLQIFVIPPSLMPKTKGVNVVSNVVTGIVISVQM